MAIKNFKKMLSMVLTMAMVWGIMATPASANFTNPNFKPQVCSNALWGENFDVVSGANNYSSSWGPKLLKEIRTDIGGIFMARLEGQYQRNTFLGIVTSRRVQALVPPGATGMHRQSGVQSGNNGNRSVHGTGTAIAFSGWADLSGTSTTFGGAACIR